MLIYMSFTEMIKCEDGKIKRKSRLCSECIWLTINNIKTIVNKQLPLPPKHEKSPTPRRVIDEYIVFKILPVPSKTKINSHLMREKQSIDAATLESFPFCRSLTGYLARERGKIIS